MINWITFTYILQLKITALSLNFFSRFFCDFVPVGMQHLVEIVCVGQPEKKHYLCTLCHLTLTSHAIIKHVLSFDHIFCYFVSSD